MSKKHFSKYQATEPEPLLTRRVFARTAFGGIGLCYAAAVGYPIYRYLKSPVQKAQAAAAVTEVVLKDAQKLPSGSALMFKFGFEPCLLIHHADGKWVALSARCTHLGCTVPWSAAERRFVCPCHASTFAITGEVSGPPAPRPLDLLEVRLENGVVKVDTGRRTRRTAWRPEQAVRA